MTPAAAPRALRRGPGPPWPQPFSWRCGKCGRFRHVMDVVAHVIDPATERRCRVESHLRCRDCCVVAK